RVAADFIRPHVMGLEALAAENVRNAPTGQSELLAEQARGPAAAARRRWGHRELDDALHGFGRNGVVFAARLGSLQETIHATFREPPSDSRDRLGGKIQPHRDLLPRDAVGTEQDNPRAAYQACPFRRMADHLFEMRALFCGGTYHVRLSHHA